MVNVCSTLKESAKLYSKVAVLLWIPSHSLQGFQLYHILSKIWYCFLTGDNCKVYLILSTVILTEISQITGDTDFFLYVLSCH